MDGEDLKTMLDELQATKRIEILRNAQGIKTDHEYRIRMQFEVSRKAIGTLPLLLIGDDLQIEVSLGFTQDHVNDVIRGGIMFYESSIDNSSSFVSNNNEIEYLHKKSPIKQAKAAVGVDATANASNNEMDIELRSPKRKDFEPIIDNAAESLSSVFMKFLNPADVVSSMSIGDPKSIDFIQLKSLKQWHNNVCGHHAYYNAKSVLNILDHVKDPHCSNETFAGLMKQMNESYPHFWESTLGAIYKLQEHGRKNKLWSRCHLENGTLDYEHLVHLVSNDEKLKDRITVIQSIEQLEAPVKSTTPPIASADGSGGEENLFTFDEPDFKNIDLHQLLSKLHDNKPHAFVIGAVTHWILIVVVSSSLVLVMDSHNKPVLTLKNDDDSRTMAFDYIEKYRSEFRAKYRESNPRYEMAPDSVLDTIFNEGLPEWWKGMEKNRIYWKHRPAYLRVKLITVELESARAYIELFADFLLNFNLHLETEGTFNKDLVLLVHQDANDKDEIDLSLHKVHKKRALERCRSTYQVHTEVTTRLFPGYVRREEDLSADDPKRLHGNDLQHRKKPPLPEVKNDVFDRQRVICDFDQNLIEHQVCLIIGTGGIGMDVALTLARLGVGEIIMVDFDKYDATNLTRQCLGTMNDVGSPKVDVAARNIAAHNLRSVIRTVQADVVKEWHRVVKEARRCTVIFNCVDVGVMFDYAANALSKELCIPLVSGQSFAWKFMSEMYTGQPHEYCAFCQETTKSTFSATMVDVGRAEFGTWDRFVKFVVQQKSLHEMISPGNGTEELVHPPRKSVKKNDNDMDIESENLTGYGFDDVYAFLTHDLKYQLIDSEITKNVLKIAYNNAQFSDIALIQSKEDLLKFIESYHDVAIQALLPGRIGLLSSLEFIPRPKSPGTRYIGSWVCPCLACGVLMVSHWGNYLTGPTNKNPPTTILFNLDEGMTADEQMGYELGISLNRDDRSFIHSPSELGCSVCRESKNVSNKQRLFLGIEDIYLRPVVPDGIVGASPKWASEEEQANSFKKEREALALSRAGTSPEILKKYGLSYENIVIPSLPCMDPLRDTRFFGKPMRTLRGIKPHSHSLGALPLVLATTPLVKTKESISKKWPSSIKGIASGKRSALVICNGTATITEIEADEATVEPSVIRLKGCGNLDQGFPVASTGDFGEMSIRGCAFEHTAIRELYMTDIINRVLVKEGLSDNDWAAANKSIGFYRYPKNQPYSENIEERHEWDGELCWELPNIDKYCIILETLGDRRLGDHLLTGIEQLFPYIVSQENVPDELLAAVSNGRGSEIVPIEELLDTSSIVECGMQVCDMSHYSLKECAPSESAGIKIREEFKSIWKDACKEYQQEINNLNNNSSSSLLFYLAWRIGWECGKICKALKDHGISWGTYPDTQGIHCNAHANNLVVRPSPNVLFLAPLDFDMAFTKDSYIPKIVEDSKQKIFPTNWDDIIAFEQTMGMMTSLAGSNFTSTGVSSKSIDYSNVDEPSKSLSNLARAAFRDTIVNAYQQSLNGSDDSRLDISKHKGCFALIKLALMLTIDTIA